MLSMIDLSTGDVDDWVYLILLENIHFLISTNTIFKGRQELRL